MDTNVAVKVLRESIAGSAKSWVLFSHGTVVLIQEREADLTIQAIELMKKWGPVHAGGPAGDFRVVELKSNGGWVVTSQRNDILTLVLPSEVAPNAMAVMIGFLGRGKRDEDARDLLVVHVEKPQRENKWGVHPANGGFAPERFPAFTIGLVDRIESEGPGNLSSTDYRLVVSDGDASVEIETTNRRGTDLFEFRGQKYAYQVFDGDDGISYTVFPVTVGPGGVWSQIPEQGTPLPWLPFELDGMRIDEDTDLPALVARTLGGWTPPAARPFERETAARWALKLWSSLTGTGLEDEVARAAGACLRSTDPLVRAGALRFFDRAGQLPGAELIEDVAAASDVDPLDGVADPNYPSSQAVPLGRSVRIALSNRVRHLREAGRDPAHALAIAKHLIVQEGRAGGLMTAVSEADWPWFEQHAEEIVKATPEVCCEVLYMLPRPDEEDMQEQGMLAARLASIPGIDAEELWMWAESFLSGDALASVRAALDARGRSKWNFG